MILNKMFCFLMSVFLNSYLYVILEEWHNPKCTGFCIGGECVLFTL